MMAVPPADDDAADVDGGGCGCDGDAVGTDDDGGGGGAFSSVAVTTVPTTTADRRMIAMMRQSVPPPHRRSSSVADEASRFLLAAVVKMVPSELTRRVGMGDGVISVCWKSGPYGVPSRPDQQGDIC